MKFLSKIQAAEPDNFTEQQWAAFKTIFDLINKGKYYQVCWGLGVVAAKRFKIGTDTPNEKGIRKFKHYTMAMSQILPACINLNPALETDTNIKEGLQKDWEYPDDLQQKGYEQGVEKILKEHRDPTP